MGLGACGCGLWRVVVVGEEFGFSAAHTHASPGGLTGHVLGVLGHSSLGQRERRVESVRSTARPV